MSSTDQYPWTLTAPTVSAILFCSEYTVNEMARRGELPCFKAGNGWVFPTRALLEHINERGIADATQRRQALVGQRHFVALKDKPASVRPDLSKYKFVGTPQVM